MKRHPWILAVLAVFLCPSLFAASQRTFVATSGLDTNPCSRTQPCRSFAFAIAQTLAAGEVYVLDSGGYGPATITSSVTIQAEGVLAGISVFSGDGIDVNVASTDVVTLRGLTINGLGGTHGISFQAGGVLHVQKVTASNLAGNGVDIAANGAQVYIDDSTLNDNSGNGLRVHGSSFVSADGCHFDHNHVGVGVEGNAAGIIRNSAANGNSTTGFNATGTIGSPASLLLESCVAAYNTFGVLAVGTAANPSLGTVMISNVAVYGNGNGLYIPGSPLGQLFGSIVSFGNNAVDGNINNGGPSSTVPQV